MSLEPLLRATAVDAKVFITLQESRLSYNTLVIYLSACRALYDEMLGLGVGQSNPFRSPCIRFPRGASKPFDPSKVIPEDVVQLLLSLPKPPRDNAIFSLLFGAGLRRCEVLNLEISDLSYNGCSVRKSKSNKDRFVSYAHWVWSTLTEYLDTLPAGTQRLFSLTPSGLHLVFKSYLEKAGLDPTLYSLHDCRTTAINKLLDEHNPIREVQAFAGHSSVRTTEVYDRMRLKPKLQLVYSRERTNTEDEK